MRRLYALLIRLHPAEFRDRFGDEMEMIYEEASGSWGKVSLLCDAAVSLARRWLLRGAIWKWAAASLGATVPLIMSFGSFIPWGAVWMSLRSHF